MYIRAGWILIIIGLTTFSYGQSIVDPKMGIVEGTTVIFIRGNVNDLAVMPGTELSFKRDKKEWKTITETKGEFSINLPEGIYTVNTGGLRMTYDFIKRAKIRVEADKTRL
ncbi:MAG: hypothetical protein ACR2LT_05165 [Pyrinomonadaceae bacterium]